MDMVVRVPVLFPRVDTPLEKVMRPVRFVDDVTTKDKVI